MKNTNRITKIMGTLLAVATVALLWTGCSKSEQPATPSAPASTNMPAK